MDSLRSFSIFMRIAIGVICFGATCLFLQLSLDTPRTGLPCNTISQDGHLVLYEDNFAYLVNDKGSLLLATGERRPKGSFRHLTYGFFKGLGTDSPIHAEFCNSNPVRLIANGAEVFKVTQEQANNSYYGGKTKVGNFALASFIGWLFFTMLIGLIDRGLLSWYFF